MITASRSVLAVRLHLDDMLRDVLGMVADAYLDAPEEVGQLLTDLGLTRVAFDEATVQVEKHGKPDCVTDHAAEAAQKALEAVIEAAITAYVTADLTRVEALALAEQLTAATMHAKGAAA